MLNNLLNKKVERTGCGNTNPQLRCRMMRCDDCRKLKVKSEGYQPVGRLDTSKPPKGGSVT